VILLIIEQVTPKPILLEFTSELLGRKALRTLPAGNKPALILVKYIKEFSEGRSIKARLGSQMPTGPPKAYSP
jgi:hypothetical protein